MHKLSDVRKALNAGEMDEALARLTCSADPAAARRRVAALLDGFRAELWQGRGYTCDPVLRPGPHGNLRQPHRPSARPRAGCGGECGLLGLCGSQRHRHYSLPVGRLADGGSAAGRQGSQRKREGEHPGAGARHGRAGGAAGLCGGGLRRLCGVGCAARLRPVLLRSLRGAAGRASRTTCSATTSSAR